MSLVALERPHVFTCFSTVTGVDDSDDDVDDDVANDDGERVDRTATNNVLTSIDENDNNVISSAAETYDVTDSEITSDIDESLQQCKIHRFSVFFNMPNYVHVSACEIFAKHFFANVLRSTCSQSWPLESKNL